MKWDISPDKPENLPKPLVKQGSLVRQESLVKEKPLVKGEPVEVTDVASALVARHVFEHKVSWLSAARSNGVQNFSPAKNGSR